MNKLTALHVAPASSTSTTVAALLALALGTACSSTPSTNPDTTEGSGGGAGATSTSDGAGGGSTSSAATGGSVGAGGAAGDAGAFDPEAGWTNPTPSADTHTFYVSSSTGDDKNDGTSPATAVKTIAAGVKLVRNGHPDWLLLRRGDAWSEALGYWNKSGASASEPVLVSYYGDMTAPRPLLQTGSQTGIYLAPYVTVNYVAFIGLHLYADARDPSSPTYDAGAAGSPGIDWLSTTDGILLEDMQIGFYSTNVVIQGTAHPITNVTLRRSVLTDAWSTGGNSEGVYLDNVANVLVEENVLDHNGWNVQAGGYRTVFNHNAYIQVTCSNVTFQRNVSTRASSHGVQVRPGGQAIDNLLVGNALAMNFGITEGGDAPTPGGVTGEVAGNVMLASDDISLPKYPRGFGLTLGNIKSASVHDNIIAHNASAVPGGGLGILLTETTGVGLNDLTLKNDIVYDWAGVGFATDYYDTTTKVNYPTAYENVTLTGEAIQVQGPYEVFQYAGASVTSQLRFSGNSYESTSAAGSWFNFPSGDKSLSQWASQTGDTSKAVTIGYKDPTRTMDSYSKSVGGAGTFADYIAQARQQARGDYRYAYTTEAALAYVRDGFTVVP